MNVSHEQDLRAEETVVGVLRAVGANDAAAPRRRHSRRTHLCVPVSRFAAAARGGVLSEADRSHHAGCVYCQKVFETLYDNVGVATGDETTVTGEDTHIDLSPRKPVDRPDAVPAVIAGRYRLGRELGHGAQGEVYEAYDAKLGRSIAFKLLTTNTDPTTCQRFTRELEVLARAQHDNVVRIYDSGVEGDRPYLVMESMPGGSLNERGYNQSPPAAVVELVYQLARGLSAIHEVGLVHGDLNPLNVMFDAAGRAAVVLGFGLARVVADDTSPTSTPAGTGTTLPAAMMGTPAYMAPEQMSGRVEAVDARADVYSLGVIFYELLTGRLPSAGDRHAIPPSALRPDLDPRLDALCLTALRRNPADRYASAREFAAALKDFL